MTTRVLLAEDHPLFRDALCALLQGQSDIEVVAMTSTVSGLVEQAVAVMPDVAVVDLSLEDGTALGALNPLRTLVPECGLLVLTSSDDDGPVYSALRAGARGYLLKSSSPEEILRAVRSVGEGNGLYGGSVVEQISRYFLTRGRSSSGSEVFPQLSARERDILDLIAAGLSNAEIADHYVLSLKTVRNHVSNVFTKLGVNTRAEAIVKARQSGLGRAE